jgi:hypothetical protein
VVTARQSVGDYLDWWIENVAKSTVRPSTWTSYDMKSWCAFTFGLLFKRWRFPNLRGSMFVLF